MNELKINIPEGYIIDKDNTNLEEGIIKFKKNEISWNDIYKHFALDGLIYVAYSDMNYWNAYWKLFYIAKYLNKSWKPDYKFVGPKYSIFKAEENRYSYSINDSQSMYSGTIYFKSKEDAETAIKIMGDDLKYLF